VNGYPQGKHAYHETSRKYEHCPKTLSTAKKPDKCENDDPYYDNAYDVSTEHRCFPFYKGMFLDVKGFLKSNTCCLLDLQYLVGIANLRGCPTSYQVRKTV
jgi:hypothetical protein